MHDIKAAGRAISAILWRDWDPIGCGVPADEYESYVWPVYKLLTDGAGAAEVAAYLRETADEALLSPVSEEKLALAVDKLMALHLAKGDRS